MQQRQVGSGPASGILKPRYRVISNLLGDTFDPVGGLDIFLDLNTFVGQLSTYSKYLQSLPFSNNAEADLVGTILMIVKHWKDFARKWEGSRVFLIFNEFEMRKDMPEQQLLKSYMYPHMNKFKNDKYSQLVYYVTEALNKVQIVLNYVPGSYLIRCNTLDSFVIPNVIDDYSKNKRVRLVVSGNSLMTNYVYMPRTKVIYTKFRHTGTVQMSDPLDIVQSLTKIDDPDTMKTFTMNRVFYNLLNAIIGDFDRGICGITQCGISCFAVDLLRAVERNKIPKDPKSCESVMGVVDERYEEYLTKTYPLVDIQQHSDLIPQSSIAKLKSTMIDQYDIDGLCSLTVEGLNLAELL